jgi:hypothetical protein
LEFITSLSGSAASGGDGRDGAGGAAVVTADTVRVWGRGGIGGGGGYEGSSRAKRLWRWKTMRRISESSSVGAEVVAEEEEAAAGVRLWVMLVAVRWREKVCLREPELSLKTERSILGGGRKSASRRRPGRGSTA